MAEPIQWLPTDQWILAQRGAKNRQDPTKPYLYLQEKERAADGSLVDVHVIFLTNRECPFRCLVCDLWKNTLDEPVQVGDIPGQIAWALERLPPAEHIKLYNSGNFFDSKAIPPGDHGSIAELLTGYNRVIIESHPLLLGDAALRFSNMLSGTLEVAMGLETANAGILSRLNKRMTTDDFRKAAEFLAGHGIDSRTFILLRPPFMSEQEGIFWAKRSIEFAFDAGTECCVVIPTRAGNGALEQLTEEGLYLPPALQSLEEVLEWGIRQGRGRVFADVWDVDRFATCDLCKEARKHRLEKMNLLQTIMAPVRCNCLKHA